MLSTNRFKKHLRGFGVLGFWGFGLYGAKIELDLAKIELYMAKIGLYGAKIE